MSELDRQVAEAQGWLIFDDTKGDGGIWLDANERYSFHVMEYTPSTDLNQAVAFAEWVMRGKLAGLYFHIGLEPNEDPRWHVSIQDPSNAYRIVSSWQSEDNLAEAICRVTLEALKGGGG